MANLEWDQKVTTHSCFQIASCTKLLTSTLLLKTIANGKISLEDRISKYIDSCPPQWSAIRIQDLISHSSGIGSFNGDYYVSTATVVRALKDSALAYPTGTDQRYSQFDFMILGYILEKIYGKPFVQVLKEEVTGPLSMRDGGFDMEERSGQFLHTEIIKQKATTYYDLKGNLVAYKFLYPQYTYTAGAYFASITDLANWAIGLDKEVLFSRKFSEPLIYGRDTINGKPGGFTKAGWASADEKDFIAAGHSGGPGLSDIIRFPKEGYTFIVLSNDGELLPGIARGIASYYIKGLPVMQAIEKFDRN